MRAIQISAILFVAWVVADIGIRTFAILFLVDSNSEISSPVVAVMAAVAVALWLYNGVWPFQKSTE